MNHSAKVSAVLSAAGLDIKRGVSAEAYDAAVVTVFEQAGSTEDDRTEAAFAKTGNPNLERRYDAALAAFSAR